jgi:DNA invertase Pin-like site-specific DNA recombinase
MKNNATQPKIYSYVRFSTDIQIKGDSLTRQRESISKYSEGKGYELDETLRFEDKGLSGYHRKNLEEGGKLYAFLEEIKKGNVPVGSILLIEALDRLSRAEPSIFLSLFIQILNAGITIVTTKDGGEFTKENFNNDISKLLTSIVIMVQANKESKDKSWRLKEAWKRKRANIGTKFYTKRIPSWLKAIKEENRIEVIPTHAETVKRMFQMILNGDHCEGIARKFIKEGVPVVGRRGAWSSSYVSQTIRNLSVTGSFQPHRIENEKRVEDGSLIQDYYPRIVSDADYMKANAVLDSRQKHGKSGRITVQNMFRGTLFCGYCGSPAYRNKKGGDKYRKNGSTFYVCSKAKEGNGCLYYAWNAKEFEQDFLKHADEIQINMVSGDDVRKKSDALEVVHLELMDVEKKIENLTDAIADGLDSSAVRTRLSDLELKKIGLRVTHEKAEREVARAKSPVATVDEMKMFLSKMDEPDCRKKAANAISAIYDKIFLFFGGNRFQFAKIVSEFKRLTKENPDNPKKVAALIRDMSDRKKHRFFVARVNGLGVGGRISFPSNAISPDELCEVGEVEEMDMVKI